MGNPWQRYLLILAFLSVAFTTFSLVGASSADGRVFVCVQPAKDVYTYYYLQYGDSLVSLDTLKGDFHCAYVPAGFEGNSLFVVVDSYGTPKKLQFPAVLRILRRDSAGSAVLEYFEPEHNVLHISATGFGVGYLRLNLDVPKSVATFDRILGPAVVYNTDPLLHLYLRAENGAMDVSGVEITGVSDANALYAVKTSLDFAACDLRVSDFSVSSVGGQVVAKFRILDGNQPVYLKDVSVLAGDALIRPQFSTDSMMYSFTITGAKFPLVVRISAPVHGCGTLSFEKRVDSVGNSVPYGIIVLIASLIVLGVAFYLTRR